MTDNWKLNTSHLGKYEEFKKIFANYGIFLEATHIDIKEIDADPILVVAHKASCFDEKVLVEDTLLDVEGVAVGIHVRWLLDHLSTCIGRRAAWITFLAYRKGDCVEIFRGSVQGTIVAPRGQGGFGFDPFFLPDGAVSTLAEAKSDLHNARVKAVEAMIQGNIWKTHPLVQEWKGPWQKG